MKIEIDSKRNNPLLNRTEIYFTIKHEGEGTPNREIIRSELADKLNVKKESVIVNNIQSSFGNQEITGYAKVYSSLTKSKNIERHYILARNKLIEPETKEKKAEAKPGPPPKKEEGEVKPPEKKQIEPTGDIKEEKSEKKPEPTIEQPKMETSETNTGESLKEEEKPSEKPPKKESDIDTEKPIEEKREQS